MAETDVVRPAGCPVLHVAQVSVSVDQHVSAAEQKQQSETAAALRYSQGLLRAYLQSRDALWRATEKEVSPPWSSPSRGAGEMLEHSR